MQAAHDWVHPDPNDYDSVAKAAIVAITNRQVDEHNQYFIGKVHGQECIMHSRDQIMSDLPSDVRNIVADYTTRLPHNDMPPAKLVCKVNAIYTLMRTISRSRKLMNGTVVRIISFNNHYITVFNYTTSQIDDIPRINFTHEIAQKNPIKILRKQYPLRLRYAMTSNLCQGKTINHMLLDLRIDPFAHGQLHVSCSRVPTSDCLRILTVSSRIICGHVRTVNVVHRCLLDNVGHQLHLTHNTDNTETDPAIDLAMDLSFLPVTLPADVVAQLNDQQ
jgi:hypothetical protein